MTAGAIGETTTGGVPGQATGRPLVFEPRLLTDMFETTVRRHGSRPAIDFMGRITRYDELGAMVDKAAAGLQALGVKRAPASRSACPTSSITRCSTSRR